MNLGVRVGLICAIALVAGRAFAADPPPPAEVLCAAAERTRGAGRAAQGKSVDPALTGPTVLSPKGFVDEGLPAYDDFLHRAIATKRVELLRFVDRDDRRVFLGLTRDGTLGIHVQQRDRR
jgi:hypothetical protein